MAPGISFLWGRASPSAWVMLPSLTLLLTHKLLAPIWPQRDISNPPGPFPPLLKPSVAPHHPRRNLCTSALNRSPSTPSPPAPQGLPVPTPPLILLLPALSCPLLAWANRTHPQVTPPGTPSCTLTYKHTYSHMHSHTYTPYLLTHTCTHAFTLWCTKSHTYTYISIYSHYAT